MDTEARRLLEAVKNGETSVDEALLKLQRTTTPHTIS